MRLAERFRVSRPTIYNMLKCARLQELLRVTVPISDSRHYSTVSSAKLNAITNLIRGTRSSGYPKAFLPKRASLFFTGYISGLLWINKEGKFIEIRFVIFLRKIIWRRGSESNRRRRLCRPLHDHSATPPLFSV